MHAFGIELRAVFCYLKNMQWLIILLQCILAIAMLDVWVIRYNRPGLVRGGNAKTMPEEFKVYNLPDWFRDLVRILKLTFGAMMILGIWWHTFAVIAGLGLAILMLGAVTMHLKVKDPFYKLLPSFCFGVICLIIANNYW